MIVNEKAAIDHGLKKEEYTKICELYDIIEGKQNEINQLKTTLEEKTFEESNFNRVSILKTQDKEIKDLKNQLDIQIRRNTLLEDKIKFFKLLFS